MNEDVILANGVNYASGGGGILNETGGYFVSHQYINILLHKVNEKDSKDIIFNG